jgi:hypothetical protein
MLAPLGIGGFSMDDELSAVDHKFYVPRRQQRKAVDLEKGMVMSLPPLFLSMPSHSKY